VPLRRPLGTYYPFRRMGHPNVAGGHEECDSARTLDSLRVRLRTFRFLNHFGLKNCRNTAPEAFLVRTLAAARKDRNGAPDVIAEKCSHDAPSDRQASSGRCRLPMAGNSSMRPSDVGDTP
jgi:hypothetical protein